MDTNSLKQLIVVIFSHISQVVFMSEHQCEAYSTLKLLMYVKYRSKCPVSLC